MSADSAARDPRRGMLAALLAYGSWGLFPIYWKLLPFAGALELVAHRVIWSSVVYLALVKQRFGLRALWPSFYAGRATGLLVACTVLLALNWLLFVYAIASGQVLQASLGYFITPVFNVVLGLLFMGETLRRWQWLAVASCAGGVAVLVLSALGPSAASAPWLALGMALTFSLYGLGRKRLQVPPLLGSSFEGVALVPLALAYLVFLEVQGSGAFGQVDLASHTLLVGSGLVTALPLLAFGIAVRELPLSVVGFFQYIAPSLQFMLAVWVYDEPWTLAHGQAFALIWAGLAIFIVDQLMALRRQHRAVP